MGYNSTLRDENQDDKQFLVDESRSGRRYLWQEKKLNNSILSMIYDKLGVIYGEYYNLKSKRLDKCGNYLEFQLMNNGNKRLVNGNFCRVRLCPMCGWRRSLKIYANMFKIMENMKDYQFIFLTLTIANCKPEDLVQTIDDMMGAWGLFVKYKDSKKVTKGWYRGLEITHNVQKDTYHPHFHVVIAVNKSYFKDRTYLSQDKWRDLWKKAMKLDYNPIVDVRKVKGNTAKDVAEVAKYTVKDEDYIDPEDLELSKDAVKLLDKALDRRRLVAFGGFMKQLHKKLNLDDEVDGSLENIDGSEKDDCEAVLKVTYAWNTGYRNYVKID